MRIKCSPNCILICAVICLTIVLIKVYNRPPNYDISRPVVVVTPAEHKKQTTQKVIQVQSTVSMTTTKHSCLKISSGELSSVKTTKHGIPFIIHQIYKDNNIPQQYVKMIQSCRKINPDFIHLMWTDKQALEFVNKVYPYHRDLYSKYKEGAQKADFFRVLLLFHFGGVYLDMDVECMKPLAESLDQFHAGAIVDHERRLQTRLRWNKNYSVMNSVMMSRKNHPFMKYLLDKFPEHLKHGNVMWRTGPVFVTDRFIEYQRKSHSKEDQVILAPPSAFSPLLDPVLFNLFNSICKGDYKKKSEPHRRGCIEWDSLKRKQNNIKELTKDSLLIHRFLHLAYGYMSHAIKSRVNYCAVIDNLYEYVP